MIKILILSYAVLAQSHPSSSDKRDAMMDDITMEKSKALNEEEENIELSPTGMTAEKRPALTPVIVKDVETLMDDPHRYNGQKVTVAGEVAKKVKDSFILKSGGMLNNRIEVQGSVAGSSVDKNDEVMVIGTVKVQRGEAIIVADQVYRR
jgi:hypothetical protein